MAFTNEEKRQFEWLMGELRRQFVEGKLAPELLLQQLEFITRADRHECEGDPEAYPMAHRRRLWFEEWYRGFGFEISILTPRIPDVEFVRRAQREEALYYRPPTTQVSHEAFMKAVGNGGPAANSDVLQTFIGYEGTEDGYWFWAESAQECPRNGWTWQALVDTLKTSNQKLISLEEYAIVWHAHCMENKDGLLENWQKWTWLRTRYNQGAMISANGGAKSFCVHGYGNKSDFVHALSATGGRAVQRVEESKSFDHHPPHEPTEVAFFGSHLGSDYADPWDD